LLELCAERLHGAGEQTEDFIAAAIIERLGADAAFSDILAHDGEHLLDGFDFEMAERHFCLPCLQAGASAELEVDILVRD